MRHAQLVRALCIAVAAAASWKASVAPGCSWKPSEETSSVKVRHAKHSVPSVCQAVAGGDISSAWASRGATTRMQRTHTTNQLRALHGGGGGRACRREVGARDTP